MKQATLIIFISLLILSSCKKDPQNEIYEGGIAIYNNNDANRIRGELKGKTIITGNIQISGTSGADLSFLKQIRKLTGDIRLYTISDIEDLTFLSGIIECEGNIHLESNKRLKSLNGLQKIKKIKTLYLYDNHELLSLDAIKDIEISHSLIIESINTSTLTTLRNVKTLDGELFIRDNGILDMSFLPNLTHVNENLYITKNSNLKTLKGLENLMSAYSCLITSNDKIENLQGLDNLTSIDYKFYINFNPSLKSISNLTNLKKVGFLMGITGNDSLTTINGLENIETVDQLFILGNDILSNFCALKPVFAKIDTFLYMPEGNLINPTKQDILKNCN